jgi:hypothetical protein
MNGTYAWMADNVASLLPKAGVPVASLLPKATAGACAPYSPFTETRTNCSRPDYCCDSSRACHHSCGGAVTCDAWTKYYCW